jgi:serine/threonine protein kinase
LLRYRLNFDEAVSHPLVQQSVQVAVEELGLIEGAQPFCKGGQSVIFVGNMEGGHKLLIKIPSYGIRPPNGHWLLRRLIVKEGLILGNVNCPALPKIYHFHPEGEYLAREFVEGQRLTLLPRTADGESRKELLMSVLFMSSMLFSAFHENERESYVIRDFKPDNIIVPEAIGELMKLIDVGSSRPERNMTSLTSDLSRLGTGKWLHWAPEQLLERIECLDRRADYFSLGATCYFVLTARAPYTNLVADTSQALARYISEYDPAVETISSVCHELGVPDDVVRFLALCLHPLPGNRPQKFIQLDWR